MPAPVAPPRESRPQPSPRVLAAVVGVVQPGLTAALGTTHRAFTADPTGDTGRPLRVLLRTWRI